MRGVSPEEEKAWSLEWESEGVMNDESGESTEPMEEVPLKELGEAEMERLVRGWRREAGSWFQRRRVIRRENDVDVVWIKHTTKETDKHRIKKIEVGGKPVGEYLRPDERMYTHAQTDGQLENLIMLPTYTRL